MFRNLLFAILFLVSYAVSAQEGTRYTSVNIGPVNVYKEIYPKTSPDDKIRFLENGQVIAAQLHALVPGEKPIIDFSSLEKWNEKKIDAAAKAIKSDIKDAVKTLESLSDKQKAMYTSFWGVNYSSFVSDLRIILGKTDKEDFIKGYQAGNLSSTSVLTELDNAIAAIDKPQVEDYAHRRYYHFDTVVTPMKVAISVKRDEPYKVFLATYYNALMKIDGNKLIAENTSLEGFLKMLVEAKSLNQTYLRFIKMTKEVADEDTLNNMYHLFKAKPEPIIQNYITAPWFLQWMWKTNGAINTTPLGFTGDDQVYIIPNLDNGRKEKLTKFLDKVNDQYLTDTSTNLDRYLKFLDCIGKEEKLLIDVDKLTAEISKNKKKKDAFLSYKDYISNISLPVKGNAPSTHYLFYSATDTSAFDKPQKINPITVDEKITITTINVPFGHSLKVTNSVSTNYDGPQFASDIGTNFAPLGVAFGSVSGIMNTINSVLNAINPWQANTVAIPKVGSGISGSQKSNGYLPIAAFEGLVVNTFDSLIRSMKDEKQRPILDKYKQEIRNDLKDLHREIITNRGNEFIDIESIGKIPFDKSFVKHMLDENFDPAKFLAAKAEMEERYRQHVVHDLIAPIVFNTVKYTFEQRQKVIMEIVGVLSDQYPPIAQIEADYKKAPSYRTEIAETVVADSAAKWRYNVYNIAEGKDKKDTTTIGSFSFKTGTRHFIQASVGFTYSFSPLTTNKVTVDNNGGLTLSSTKEQYGVAAMLHVYPLAGGVFLQDNSFCGRSWENVKGRINIAAGLDFRKVPDNVYLGVGYDFGLGLRLNLGFHFYKYTQYEVRNNQITNQSIIYKTSLPFIYLGIDPVALVKTISNFKK